ncbi:MAG: hypothetical protein R2822_13550 [Spirosomataceae bacterium]
MPSLSFMRFFLKLLVFVSSVAIYAQQPRLFEPNLISKGGVFGFTSSPKGNEAFWVQSNGGRDTLVIMYSQRIKGKWQSPQVASFSGKSWKDIDPIFSPDGKTVLFQSNRPVPNKLPNPGDFDIWAVNKTTTGWSEAYHLGNVINSDASESFASITNNGHIYFMKENPDGIGTSDLYVSKKINNVYQPPMNLGQPINTRFRESNPYISPDEDYIIYFSSDSTGFGEVDLYISFLTKGQWSNPKNLGKPINSEVGEFCPFVHQKQRRIYFSRTVQQKNGRRVENIYSFPFDVRKYKEE